MRNLLYGNELTVGTVLASPLPPHPPAMASPYQVILACAAALALASLPRVAKAQSADGKFSLPSEVHWGYLTLPKGDYTFTVSPFGGASMIEVRKEGKPSRTFFIGVQGRDRLPDSSLGSRLVLDRVNGELYVKKLELQSTGMAYLYAAPTSKELLLSKDLPQGQRIGPSGK